jgi:hypothetical protein
MMPGNRQAFGCTGGDNPGSTSLHDSTASFPVDPISVIELPIAAVRLKPLWPKLRQIIMQCGREAVPEALSDRDDGDCKASGDKQRPRLKRASLLQSRESADPLPYATWTVGDQEPGSGRLPYRMLRYLVMQLQLQQLRFSAQDSCHAHFIPEPAWSQPARSCIVE